MANKYYAVKDGRKIGIFETWNECQKSVEGYSGAQYKSFKNKEDAIAYLNDEKGNKKIDNLNQDEMIAYVDGGYDSSKNYYSYAVILFQKDDRIEYSGLDNKTEIINMNNVAGEIEAAKLAMRIAVKKEMKKLYIYYDYEGIEKWCTGEWKSRKRYTKEYKNYYKEIKENLKVKFIKVEAHSGNKLNEEVDLLAKKVLNNVDKINSNPEKDNLVSSKLGKNQKIPVLNIIKEDGNIIYTDEIFSEFKELWELKDKHIEDIDDLKITYNIEKDSMLFYVKFNDQVEKINIEL